MPDQLKEQVLRRWERGDIARARILDEDLFPLEIRLKKPRAKDVAERFGAVMEWVDHLREQSRERTGYGYSLRWERVNNRVQGANDLPVAAVVYTENDALRLIRRENDAERLCHLVDKVLSRFPALKKWIARRSRIVLEHEDQWDRLLAVVDWFVANPQSNLYLRQLDIPGVDTKFIEAHRGILSEMLDQLLPASSIDTSYTGVSNFASRYGLRQEPAMIRFRILDPTLYIHGLSDMAVLPAEFNGLRLRVSRVFITENRINGLAFPECPQSIVIFGLGYGIDRLADISWLRDTQIWYWGDIDTHGFGILHRIRTVLPHAQSFLMDRKTLMAHQDLWGQEPADKRYEGDPGLLTDRERSLFDDLRHNRIGQCVRLEQERVRWSWLNQHLKKLVRVATS